MYPSVALPHLSCSCKYMRNAALAYKFRIDKVLGLNQSHGFVTDFRSMESCDLDSLCVAAKLPSAKSAGTEPAAKRFTSSLPNFRSVSASTHADQDAHKTKLRRLEPRVSRSRSSLS